MGEIADGILNGDFDEETGEYIGPGDGYPRSLAREKREGHKNELGGIQKYLIGKGCTAWRDVMKHFELTILKREFNNEHDAAKEIQKDFGAFVRFVKQQIKQDNNYGKVNRKK